MRENPAGEARKGSLRLCFDGRLRLEFRGAGVTTGTGLPAVRGPDEALQLAGQAGDLPADGRTGKNTRHGLAGLLRKSVYARLGGHKDVNDQEGLTGDPAVMAVAGRKVLDKNAAGP